MKKIKGFTLLELMSVVLILTVLATMSVVGFRKAINHQRLIGETNNAAATLKVIGTEARVSKRNIRVNVDFDTESIIGWIDSDEDGIQDSAEKVIEKFTAPKGVDIFSGFFGSKRFSGIATFSFLDDGKASKEAIVVIKGIVTSEFKTVAVNMQSGWIEVHDGAPPNLKSGQLE
ncbi:prepilin-type N-terminal cleavage/methylation domain-containing protein [bacterium]|nr:prepilin-type N-terminal cleavage/methylation domain-containing protein [bacterium]